jgi:hypothetical protein
MEGDFPTQQEVCDILTKIEGIIGLSASFPQSRYQLQPDQPKAERYRQLWQDIQTAISELNRAGIPFGNPNPHQGLSEMWAWCWTNPGDSAAVRMSRPSELYKELRDDLKSLQDSLTPGFDAPAEVLRELRESRRRANELFVIMAFRPETDGLWKDVIVPVADELGLRPVRIDKEETEVAISEEILSSIRRALLVLCDLSFERPNCYFEAGFAKGAFRRVIFSARSDHNPRGPKTGEWKIHFDLDQYKISWWSPDSLQEAKADLKSRIDKIVSEIQAGSFDNGSVSGDR